MSLRIDSAVLSTIRSRDFWRVNSHEEEAFFTTMFVFLCFQLKNKRSDQPNQQDRSIIDHISGKNAISRAVGVGRSLLFSPSARRNIGDLPGHFRHVQVSMLLSLLCALLSVLFFFYSSFSPSKKNLTRFYRLRKKPLLLCFTLLL